MQGIDPAQLQALLGGRGNNFGGPAPLVEFKAGRMNYDGRMVTPDRRKGKIRVISDPMQPGLFQFQWQDEQGTTHEDLMVFPGSAKFEKVKQTEDRVYLLELDTNRFFYWMQEPDKEKDAERCKKVSDTLSGVQPAQPA